MEGSGLQPLRGTEMSQNKKGNHTQVQERVVMMMGPDHRVAVKLIGVNVDSTGPQNSDALCRSESPNISHPARLAPWH